MFSNALKSFTSNITSNYILSPAPVSQSGPWKIHDGKKKKTNQPVSVFVFDRKSLEHNNSSSSSLSLRGSSSKDGIKAAQDEVVERLKKEASLLARLRHPCILELVEPVEDTRSGGLMFVTEPVTGSLAVLLAEKDEDEARNGRYVSDERGRRRRDVEIDELEIQKGLLQIGKALEFLHESAALIHGNLTPEAIMVNAKSDWKLASLSFTITSINPPLPAPYDPRLPPHVQLSLDYASPDLILDQTLSPSADIFSLGLLIVALYNHPHKSPIEAHHSTSKYRQLLSSPSTTPNSNNNFISSKPLPRPLLNSLLPKLLTRRPAGRLTAREFQQSEYFDNILVSTLRFLDSLPAKTPSEKSSFMRGLPKVLPQFPRSVLEKKILPGLVEELRDGSMLALVLPNIFIIVEASPARIFSDKVLKRLKEVFIPSSSSGSTPTPDSQKTAAAKIAEREREAGREGGLSVILGNLGVVKEKTTAREFKEDVLPLYHLALESPTHALQDLALRSLATILPKMDFPTVKNELFPVVSGVFTKTSSLGIKIRGLEAFKVLCGGSEDSNSGDGLDGFQNNNGDRNGGRRKEEAGPELDKYTIQEKVVPLLKGIKTKEPAVMMAALDVFREIGRVCDKEVVAMEIMPTLWGMSMGPLLGLEQFKAFMATIKTLSNKIEHEQIRKLQDLNAVSADAGEFLSFGATANIRSPSPGGENEFENLVFGRLTGNNNDSSNNSNNGGETFDSGWATPKPSFSSGTTNMLHAVPVSQSQPPSLSSKYQPAQAPTFSWSTPTTTATAANPKSTNTSISTFNSTTASTFKSTAASTTRNSGAMGNLGNTNMKTTTIDKLASFTPLRPSPPPTMTTFPTNMPNPMQPLQPTRPGTSVGLGGAGAFGATSAGGGASAIDWGKLSSFSSSSSSGMNSGFGGNNNGFNGNGGNVNGGNGLTTRPMSMMASSSSNSNGGNSNWAFEGLGAMGGLSGAGSMNSLAQKKQNNGGSFVLPPPPSGRTPGMVTGGGGGQMGMGGMGAGKGSGKKLSDWESLL
ncbi:Protein kinase domain-containing protein ppk32 [Rhizina undulata]